tara:strand:- start:1076 stop:1303 length:228 start_codon:yes stop_codon:yes gene_type:complete
MLTTADIKRIKDAPGRVKELDNSLSIALEINDKYQRENKVLKKEVEGLKAELTKVKADYEYDNLVHQKELKDLRK